jgi:hypothetical protein
VVDEARIATLRAQGFGWKKIATELGVGVGTLYRGALDGSKIQARDFKIGLIRHLADSSSQK